MKKLIYILLVLIISSNASALVGGNDSCFSENECPVNLPSSVHYSIGTGLCSATKIGPRHFLTAAHCKKKTLFGNINRFRIKGMKKNTHVFSSDHCRKFAHKFESEIEKINDRFISCMRDNVQKYKKINIVKWHVHPNYLANDINSDDIAIFEIEEATDFWPVAEICKNIKIYSGTSVIITGASAKKNLKDREDRSLIERIKYFQTKVKSIHNNTFTTNGRSGLIFDNKKVAAVVRGDSGSAVYIDQGGQKCVIGINKFVSHYPYYSLAYEHSHTALGLKSSALLDWVDSIIN